MSEFTYNKLVYKQKVRYLDNYLKQITYYRIKNKYKPIEDLYDEISTNLNIYILANKFNSIAADILAVYRTITNMMNHFDICPTDNVCFDSVKMILFMIQKYWVNKMSYIIEDRLCLDQDFFLKGNVFAKKQIFHRPYEYDDILEEMKTKFTYTNSIIYIKNIKLKIENFSKHLGKYVIDNRINAYIFKVNACIAEYIKEYDRVFQTRAAKVIQRAFRKYRYDPQYSFCERVQTNNLVEIYNEFNMQL